MAGPEAKANALDLDSILNVGELGAFIKLEPNETQKGCNPHPSNTPYMALKSWINITEMLICRHWVKLQMLSRGMITRHILTFGKDPKCIQ